MSRLRRAGVSQYGRSVFVNASCIRATLSNALLDKLRRNSRNHLSTGSSSGESGGSRRKLTFSGCTSFARSDGLARRRGRREGADLGISLRAHPRIPQGIRHPSRAATYTNSPRSWVRPPRTGKPTCKRVSRHKVDGTPSGSSASYAI